MWYVCLGEVKDLKLDDYVVLNVYGVMRKP
jgi:hypothetical protein